jgi:hypothetical protein
MVEMKKVGEGQFAPRYVTTIEPKK